MACEPIVYDSVRFGLGFSLRFWNITDTVIKKQMHDATDPSYDACKDPEYGVLDKKLSRVFEAWTGDGGFGVGEMHFTSGEEAPSRPGAYAVKEGSPDIYVVKRPRARPAEFETTLSVLFSFLHARPEGFDVTQVEKVYQKSCKDVVRLLKPYHKAAWKEKGRDYRMGVYFTPIGILEAGQKQMEALDSVWKKYTPPASRSFGGMLMDVQEEPYVSLEKDFAAVFPDFRFSHSCSSGAVYRGLFSRAATQVTSVEMGVHLPGKTGNYLHYEDVQNRLWLIPLVKEVPQQDNPILHEVGYPLGSFPECTLLGIKPYVMKPLSCPGTS